MDLELSDEQRWLAESVAELLARRPGPQAWPALVEFGTLSIASGGDGLGAVELALIGREIGARLESVPFVETTSARYATRLLADSDRPPFVEMHAGQGVTSLGLLEPGGGWELERQGTVLRPGGCAGSVLDGNKVGLQDPAAADWLLVLCSDRGAHRLALIPSDAEGIELRPSTGIDDSLLPGSLTLSHVRISEGQILAPDLSEAVLVRLLAIGGVVAASEAVGAAGRLVELACEYATQRRQFGRSIVSFQALRHILADMHVRQVSAWSSVLYAAAALEDGIPGAIRTTQVAKAYASRATLEAAHGAVQVFGGVAFTSEHPAHRFLRRIIARGSQFGDARHHERAIGRALATADDRDLVMA